jgi:hypothetical protein
MPPAPPADDRSSAYDEDDEPTPGRPHSLHDLLSIWADRDESYRRYNVHSPLSDKALAAIREFRMKEVNDISPYERAEAWGIAKTWNLKP